MYNPPQLRSPTPPHPTHPPTALMWNPSPDSPFPPPPAPPRDVESLTGLPPPSPPLPPQELALWNGLADCYEQGLVRAVGVSNYGPKQLRKVHKDLAKRGVPLASAQVGGALWGSSTRRHR